MIPYRNITLAVALRANQIGDATSAEDLETKFAQGDLTVAMEGLEVPVSALKMAVLASEKRIASCIANSQIDALRAPLYGRTDDLVDGDEIPSTGDGNKEFVGTFGNVCDGETDDVLSEKPLQTIRRYNRHYTSGSISVRPMHYCKAAGRLYHTREIAYLEGCIWDYDTQSDAYDTQSEEAPDNRIPSPLPQEVEIWWIADVLANLPQENWYLNEAAFYQSVANMEFRRVVGGKMPAATLPDRTATPEPVAN